MNKWNFKLFLTFLALVSCTNIPSQEPKASDSAISKTIELKLVTDDKNCGQYFLNTKFDGKKILGKLDTGSTLTTVPENNFFNRYPAARLFKLQGAAGVSINAPAIDIDNIEIDGFSLDLNEAIRNPVASAPPTIGINALNAQPFGFDFPNKHLLLNPMTPAGTLPNLIVAKDGRLLIETEFDKERFSTMIDTGYCYTTVDSSVIRRHPDNFSYEKDGEAIDPTGHTVKFRFYRMKDFKFPGFKLSNILVAESDLSINSKSLGQSVSFILGVDNMSMAKWYFDPANKKWSASF